MGNNPKRGKFIVIEGLDGCGKSTQIEMLEKKMKEHGMAVHLTREPSDGEIGLFTRSVVDMEKDFPPETLIYLFLADRIDHIKNEMLPMLEKGINVICDRYYFSSYAYQSNVIGMEALIKLNKPMADLLKPDIAVYIDVPPEKCFERITLRCGDISMFDNLQSLNRIEKGYKNAFEYIKNENIVLTDGTQKAEDVSADIWSNVIKVI